MKTLLACFGGVVVVLAVLGAFGVGNFVMMYGPEKIVCAKEKE